MIAATENWQPEPLFQIGLYPVIQEETLLTGHGLGRYDQEISVKAVSYGGEDITSSQKASHRDSSAKIQIVDGQASEIHAEFAIHIFHAITKGRKEDPSRYDRSTDVAGFSSPLSSHGSRKFIEEIPDHTDTILH